MHRLKVYVRCTLIATMAVAALLVLFKNRSNRVPVWFFGLTDSEKPTNVVWLIFSVIGATLWLRWVFSLGWGLWHDICELQKRKEFNEAAKKLEARTSQLEERERHLDDKLRRAVGAADAKADEGPNI
jgi:hypothetical protein